MICVTGVHEVEVGGREEGGSLAEGLRTLGFMVKVSPLELY